VKLMMKSLVAAVALVSLGACTSMEDRLGLNIPTYSATLAPGAGIASTGSGRAVATLDTKTNELGYTIDYAGLSGPATMAHIHGPAAEGANAGVIAPLVVASPTQLAGKVTLTEAQIADLNAGKYYVNIHTDANKGGEVRGTLKLFVMPEVRVER
jgi:hypothetical protein